MVSHLFDHVQGRIDPCRSLDYKKLKVSKNLSHSCYLACPQKHHGIISHGPPLLAFENHKTYFWKNNNW